MKNIISLCLVVGFIFLLSGYQYKAQYNKQNVVEVESSNLDYKTVHEFNNALECLTLNIYMEAGVESIQGKLAVGTVTINRLKSGKYGDTICKVVYAKNQFSWTMDTPQNIKNLRNTNVTQYKESKEVAKKILIEKFYVDSLKSSLHYHADYITMPTWARDKKRLAKIGRHIFYEN